MKAKEMDYWNSGLEKRINSTVGRNLIFTAFLRKVRLWLAGGQGQDNNTCAWLFGLVLFSGDP